MTINKILVVGAGELGSRHLQSLAAHMSASENRAVYVCDPSAASLTLAQTRVEQVIDATQANLVFHWSNTLDFAVADFDMVLIATNANIRLTVIKNVLAQYHVNCLMLEKVLFQSERELVAAQSLLSEKNIKTWVNCPRRLFDSYKQLKKRLRGGIAKLSVTGSQWGMACNAVHFIDLWFFLTDLAIERYDIAIDGLASEVFDSKRPGFKEISGQLVCTSNTSQLILQCDGDQPGHLQDNPLTVTIENQHYTIVVNESAAITKIFDKQGVLIEEISFATVYQSQITGHIASELFDKQACGLTPFEESCRIHLPFLRGLAAYFERVIDSDNNDVDITNSKSVICPIT